MVEAAGIEPASEKVQPRASTRLADSFFYLADRPLSGKWTAGQPRSFIRPLGASRPNYPEFASPRQSASGEAIRETSQSIKLRGPNYRWQLMFSRRFYETPRARHALLTS